MTDVSGKKRVNLRDVAKAAGVSVATVSRVLNSPNAVTEKTRTRVQEVIDQLNFVPSAAARAINSGRTRFVGALVPTLDNAIFARFLAALERTLGEHQLSLVVATTNSDQELEANKAKGLLDIGAEGLIVSGITHSADLRALIDRARVPTIATSYFDKSCALPTIGYDNCGAALLALEHLYDLGHRRVAVVHGPAQNNDRTQDRIRGLKLFEQKTELSWVEAPIGLQGGAEAARQVLSHGPKPDAILCLSDVLAMGMLFGLQGMGVSVPQDLSLMGIDDLPGSAVTVPPLSTVHLPVHRMGEQAATALANWVEHDTRPDHQQLDAHLIVRGSTVRRKRNG
ncbi:Ribose operon repressor [Falsiruegeria litorea R37]|uniref:Ribose operon repressor n=1 Tax=Falsiruegeria litorea R37 TaxID=1200284 RepID=A0A1Y5TVK4_9RHOB|nr:LacI family DNA-binding transcriptional regulator [Falsiruegeria litorea]SLN73807.1 Ribose operon repressor [Falsiruegeria litorea R37]